MIRPIQSDEVYTLLVQYEDCETVLKAGGGCSLYNLAETIIEAVVWRKGS